MSHEIEQVFFNGRDVIPTTGKSLLLRRELWIALVAFGGVIIYVIGAGFPAGFPLDDSWIHQTYARNLAQNGEWAFVTGQPSAGNTAPFYTLLLSVGYFLGLPYLWWTAFLGGTALALAGIVAARLADRLAPDARHIGLLSGLATVGAWHMVWAAASGMETALFAALTLSIVALAWREMRREMAVSSGELRSAWGRGLLLGAVGALATLSRPEGMILVGLTVLAMALARPQASWRGFAVWTAGVLSGWLAGVGPYALLNLNLTGTFLPNTAAAKQAEYAVLLGAPYFSRIMDLLRPLTAGGQMYLLPGLLVTTGLLVRRAMRNRSAILHLLPLLWALVLIGLYAARLPATYQHGRYVIPALPHLILFGVVGTAMIWRWGSTSLGGRVLSRSLGLAALLLFPAYWIIGGQQYADDVRIIQEEMVTTAHWLAANVAPDELLAVHDIGAVGYFTPRSILDLAGLLDRDVIPIMADPDALWTLLQARNARYLMAFPNQIPGRNPSDPRLCPVYASDGTSVIAAGGANMAVYALAWDGVCPP